MVAFVVQSMLFLTTVGVHPAIIARSTAGWCRGPMEWLTSDSSVCAVQHGNRECAFVTAPCGGTSQGPATAYVQAGTCIRGVCWMVIVCSPSDACNHAQAHHSKPSSKRTWTISTITPQTLCVARSLIEHGLLVDSCLSDVVAVVAGLVPN